MKLEGRGRSSDYVHTVTEVYREAADAWLAGEYTDDKIAGWYERLENCF